jgi:hypothetical protein
MNTLNKNGKMISLYEKLRNQVITASYASAGFGLGLFVQRGMVLWMKCLQEDIKEESRMEQNIHSVKTTGYPRPPQDELVNILVNMISSHREAAAYV